MQSIPRKPKAWPCLLPPSPRVSFFFWLLLSFMLVLLVRMSSRLSSAKAMAVTLNIHLHRSMFHRQWIHQLCPLLLTIPSHHHRIPTARFLLRRQWIHRLCPQLLIILLQHLHHQKLQHHRIPTARFLRHQNLYKHHHHIPMARFHHHPAMI